MAAAVQVAIQEKESLQASIKGKDHTLDLLSMDKVYFTLSYMKAITFQRNANHFVIYVSLIFADIFKQRGQLPSRTN